MLGPEDFAEESAEVRGRQEPGSQGRKAKVSCPWQATAGALPTLKAGLFPPAKPCYVNRCWAEHTRVSVEGRAPRVSTGLSQCGSLFSLLWKPL